MDVTFGTGEFMKRNKTLVQLEKAAQEHHNVLTEGIRKLPGSYSHQAIRIWAIGKSSVDIYRIHVLATPL